MKPERVRDRAEELISTAKPVDAGDGWERPTAFDEGPLPSFPVNALGDGAAQVVREVERALQVPPAMPAMLMLVAAATCVAKKFEVVLRQGWTQSLNLYVLVAMSPGERKTSVMRAVTSPITDWEGRREVELAPQIGPVRVHG